MIGSAQSTAVFCEYRDKIWNIVNSKETYNSGNDEILEEFVKFCKDSAVINGGRQKFLSLYAFQIVKSIIDLNNYLTQHVNSGIRLIASNSTQVALENLFSQFRSYGNTKPSSYHLYYVFRNVIFMTYHRHISNSPYDFANSRLLLTLSEIERIADGTEPLIAKDDVVPITVLEKPELAHIRLRVCKQVAHLKKANCQTCKNAFDHFSASFGPTEAAESAFRSLVADIRTNSATMRKQLQNSCIDVVIPKYKGDNCKAHMLLQNFIASFVDIRLRIHSNKFVISRKANFGSRSRSK